MRGGEQAGRVLWLGRLAIHDDGSMSVLSLSGLPTRCGADMCV